MNTLIRFLFYLKGYSSLFVRHLITTVSFENLKSKKNNNKAFKTVIFGKQLNRCNSLFSFTDISHLVIHFSVIPYIYLSLIICRLILYGRATNLPQALLSLNLTIYKPHYSNLKRMSR